MQPHLGFWFIRFLLDAMLALPIVEWKCVFGRTLLHDFSIRNTHQSALCIPLCHFYNWGRSDIGLSLILSCNLYSSCRSSWKTEFENNHV
ncbi:hypothetical protein FKM82_008832 [Ascaphus truei]